MGDPAGIGLDLVAMVWARRTTSPVPPFVFYGDDAALVERANLIGCPIATRSVVVPPEAADAAAFFHQALPVRNIPLAAPVVAGSPNETHAAAICGAIETAVKDTMASCTAAIVTHPIAKHVLYRAGFSYPGHTEFLAALAEKYMQSSEWLSPGWQNAPLQSPILAEAAGPRATQQGRTWRSVMMLAGPDIRVVPLTVHIPLKDVPQAITHQRILETVRILATALSEDFGIARPRIAVAGLNPHAGEEGRLGREEQDVIAPAIRALAAEGYAVTGPHPADTLFHAAARRTHDVVIAMYHDQGLAPFKALAFDTGVNVTLGLPFVRTSPDHGTAFDIAGKGRALPNSFIAALEMASEIAARRYTAHGSTKVGLRP